MSTILDALKKSEQDRRLKDIPTLSNMPTPEEKPSRVLYWLFSVFCGLLVLVLVGLGILIFRDNGETSTAVAPPASGVKSVSIGQNVDDEILINVISWSEDANERFAFVNGKMVRENQFVRPGLKVISISVDSVVLIDRGKRLELRP